MPVICNMEFNLRKNQIRWFFVLFEFYRFLLNFKEIIDFAADDWKFNTESEEHSEHICCCFDEFNPFLFFERWCSTSYLEKLDQCLFPFRHKILLSAMFKLLVRQKTHPIDSFALKIVLYHILLLKFWPHSLQE